MRSLSFPGWRLPSSSLCSVRVVGDSVVRWYYLAAAQPLVAEKRFSGLLIAAHSGGPGTGR